MAKLYFRYGAMGSAKTLNLLAVRHNYWMQGKKALLLKPSVDTRFGADVVQSRAGLCADADYVIPASGLTKGNILVLLDKDSPDCILVDEAQFLAPYDVEILRDVATMENIPVICYGLRTDFRTNTFPGSLRLLEMADTIEEVKTTCWKCSKKAVFNMRVDPTGNPVTEGESIEIGAEDKYIPVCPACYSLHTRSAGRRQ